MDRNEAPRRHPAHLMWRSFRRSAVVAFTVALTLTNAACVQSEKPLLQDTKPLVGPQFALHIYESIVDGKATDFHISTYKWDNSRYVRGSRSGQDAFSIAAVPLDSNDYLVEGTNQSGGVFNYWIGRKIAEGTYLIFGVEEDDADEATRARVCAKGQPAGICIVDRYEDLLTLARATAKKGARNPALGVLVAR